MALSRFSASTHAWFTRTFGQPTPVQAEAWRAIADGGHALVVAPTGSGKTLAAFLWALDGLLQRPRQPGVGTRVVYVSPLKALGADVERNLRTPLAGIGAKHVTVGVRSGDTTASQRARLRRQPPDILITTPESLYLMLTSGARDTLRDVETVIIDEIHAIAGTKRGTHQALSLERLDLTTGHDVQRIALSATVRPVDQVARFLGGDREVTVVAPPTSKQWDVALATPPLEDPWPTLEHETLEAICRARSTLVFTNSRRAAEKLTAQLNELWAERGGDSDIARAHHGSVSPQVRREIEEALKSGQLRAVVATSSLELGIDMGAVEQVFQIGSPLSTASALQRIGRAGHQVGALSYGRIRPLHRGELAAACVTTEDLLAGRIEELHIPLNPLDVLGQQTVAAAAAAGEAGLDLETWLRAVRRSFPYAELTDDSFHATLQLLLGTYPSADFSELRARLEHRDDRLFALPGALRLAVTSGGTIPDRGLYAVYLADGEGPGRRVGELDEEMVHETRVGETIALGASSWTVVGITRDQVLVLPAPGQVGKLPFWVGEDQSRPAELGRRIGQLQRQAAKDPTVLAQPWIDEATRTALSGYLAEQQRATGTVPDDRTVVVERFRDELGDWRVIVHSPLGRAVMGPWATAVAGLIEQRSGVDPKPVVTDDGFILRLPDGELPALVADLLQLSPETITSQVSDLVGGTSLFAARFRECAARFLLLPRRHGKRMPLWQQRHRAAQLLQAAQGHPHFPVAVEAVRECLHDYWDLPSLIQILTELRAGQIRVVDVLTPGPSPFAASMLFRYAGGFMYEGDLPIAERRAAALALDPALLTQVLGGLDLYELLDPEVSLTLAAELQLLADGYRARTVTELAEIPRRLGPLTRDELARRSEIPIPDPLPEALTELTWAGRTRIVARTDLPLLRDALGLSVPDAPVSEPEGRDPLAQLVARFARTHTPFTPEDLAQGLGLSTALARRVLTTEVAAGRLLSGRFTTAAESFCDASVLDRVRGRSLAAARAAIEPVTGEAYARFLATHHGIATPRPSSPDEVLLALQRLAGLALPASQWESHILPARLTHYSPHHLDQLVAQGEVVIRVRSASEDPLICLVAPEDLDLVPPPEPATPADEAFAAALGDGLVPPSSADQLWAAAAAGLVAPATMSAIRSRAAIAPPPTPRTRRPRLPRPSRPATIQALPGRWYPVADQPEEPTASRLAELASWLDRYAVITRPLADGPTGGFSARYPLLRELEDRGTLRRGHFVAHLGAAQFTTPETVEALRVAREPTGSAAAVLSVLDPANPFGSLLPWPEHDTTRPTRTTGAVVVIADGQCLAHLSANGRRLTLFPHPTPELAAGQVMRSLVSAVTTGRMQRFRIEEIDGGRATAHENAGVLLKAGARIHPQGLVVDQSR